MRRTHIVKIKSVLGAVQKHRQYINQSRLVRVVDACVNKLPFYKYIGLVSQIVILDKQLAAIYIRVRIISYDIKPHCRTVNSEHICHFRQQRKIKICCLFLLHEASFCSFKQYFTGASWCSCSNRCIGPSLRCLPVHHFSDVMLSFFRIQMLKMTPNERVLSFQALNVWAQFRQNLIKKLRP